MLNVKTAPIPETVRQFICDNIYSVEQLEVLLLLRRTLDQQWSVTEICKELHTTEVSVKARLNTLLELHLLNVGETSATVCFQYQALDLETDAVIGELERTYRERKDTVIALIFTPRARF